MHKKPTSKTGTNDAGRHGVPNWKPEPPGKAYYEFLAKKQLWDKQAAEFYEKLDKEDQALAKPKPKKK